jgi:microcystin-dependent protein
MQQYTTPFKAHSVPFKANGVFYGVVVAVNDKRLDIKVPRMTGDAVFKNIEYADSAVTDTPAAGELLLVSFLEGDKDDLVVLGRVKSSLDRPDVDLTGAVAGDFLQYDGTKFIAADIDLGSLTVGNYVATIAGTASEIDVSGSGVEGAAVTLSLPTTINANTTGSAAKWTNSRTITLGGDLSGSVSFDGSANATLTATVAANSVALGTDTTGNYMAGVSAGTGISVSHTPGEGSTATVTNSGVTSLTGTASQVTASASTGAVTLSLPSSINVNTTGSAAKWTTARTITLGGDLTGSVSIDGSANATLTATVAANSVALGTDTTGNYVATIAAGTNLSISAGSGTGEGSTPTLATSTTPSFSTITSTVADGTPPFTVASTTAVTNLNADLLDGQHGSFYAPTGMMAPFAGSSSPTGWLLCDGSLKSQTTYSALFALIGTTYGPTVGSDFRLPDLRGRVPVGLDNMGGTDADRLTVANTLGDSGGVQTVTLTDAQIANHSHGHTLGTNTTGSTHTHAAGSYDGTLGINNNLVTDGGGGTAYQALTPSGSPNSRIVTNTTGSTHTHNITGSVSATTAGGGPHDNMQPYILTNYIIKT